MALISRVRFALLSIIFTSMLDADFMTNLHFTYFGHLPNTFIFTVTAAASAIGLIDLYTT